jgi:hypothetical protein
MAAGLSACAITVAAIVGSRVYHSGHPRPIIAQLRAAQLRGEAADSSNPKHRFFNIVEETREVLSAASKEDINYLVDEAVRGTDKVGSFLLLYELIARGERGRIVEFLAHIDWGEPGWGDFWHSDVEYRLATVFPASRPFEGLEALFDAAEAATTSDIRQHLLSRIRFSLGTDALAGVPDSQVVALSRNWLTQNRDQIEINDKYPAFMDGAGPVGNAGFGSEFAEYLVRQKAPKQRGG